MTTFDLEQIDHLLSTTRTVRKRLDFERPVADDVLLHMIDLAEQALSGSNQHSRRWLIIRDAGLKKQIAELYRDAGIAALNVGLGSSFHGSNACEEATRPSTTWSGGSAASWPGRPEPHGPVGARTSVRLQRRPRPR